MPRQFQIIEYDRSFEPWFSKFYGLIWVFIVTLSIQILLEKPIKKGEASKGDWEIKGAIAYNYILRRKDKDCGYSEIF
jgi:hypothetical protein